MLIRCSARLIVVVLLCLVAIPLPPPSAADQAWVRVRPATGNYATGQTIDVEVWIEDVQSIYAADVQLAFDPERLAVVDAKPGTPAIEVEPRDDLLSPDWILRNVADNGAGTVWYAVSQLNPSEAVSGSGAFYAFSFRTLKGGPAQVEVTYYKLVRRDGSTIPSEAAGAAYQITGEVNRYYMPLIQYRD